ncbi:MAG: diacylglycerol kinase family lipid kinase [Bacteroidetes bacterium]|nr:diacylglycerol kinase family lipid kinase [Bacteroidota bacterium]MBS1539844.1 diacylglycerol kinase family lipid kinase [Bacteroidota bacterium]
MKVAIILNGISRKKIFFYRQILPALAEKFDVAVWETQYDTHARELAARATMDHFDFVLAAGGDGTLHHVVNGVMTCTEPTPTIGIIPLGTGNDFAKMCGITADAHTIIKLLNHNLPASTDIGKIECHNDKGERITEHFINVCSVGLGPEVVKRLQGKSRVLGPWLTYQIAVVTAFFTHRPQELSIDAHLWKWKGKARVFAIANGQSFGSSMYIAPDARPDDGIFSTFLAGNLHWLAFLKHLSRIKTKTKIQDSDISYNVCNSVSLTSAVPTWIEAEGELVGMLPAQIDLLPQRIKFLR